MDALHATPCYRCDQGKSRTQEVSHVWVNLGATCGFTPSFCKYVYIDCSKPTKRIHNGPRNDLTYYYYSENLQLNRKLDVWMIAHASLSFWVPPLSVPEFGGSPLSPFFGKNAGGGGSYEGWIRTMWRAAFGDNCLACVFLIIPCVFLINSCVF